MVDSLLRGNDFGGNPQEGGNQYFHVKDVHSILTPEHAALSARVLNEFAYNSETNGDGVKMFILGQVRPS